MITAEQLAYARTHAEQGGESSLSRSGSYTLAGFVHLKGEMPIRVARSPLVNVRLAGLAVKANRAGNYFSDSEQVYERFAKQAEEDKSKDPEKRRAVVLPNNKPFQVSSRANPDVFRHIFGKAGEDYLQFMGRNSITVYPVDVNTVNAQDETILTQEWLSGLDDGSNVYGDERSLNYNYAVRGVQRTGGASSQKKSSTGAITQYSTKQLDRLIKVMQGVREGKLPASRLEREIKFAESLRSNE